jgi:hypothetical protein
VAFSRAEEAVAATKREKAALNETEEETAAGIEMNERKLRAVRPECRPGEQKTECTFCLVQTRLHAFATYCRHTQLYVYAACLKKILLP